MDMWSWWRPGSLCVYPPVGRRVMRGSDPFSAKTLLFILKDWGRQSLGGWILDNIRIYNIGKRTVCCSFINHPKAAARLLRVLSVVQIKTPSFGCGLATLPRMHKALGLLLVPNKKTRHSGTLPYPWHSGSWGILGYTAISRVAWDTWDCVSTKLNKKREIAQIFGCFGSSSVIWFCFGQAASSSRGIGRVGEVSLHLVNLPASLSGLLGCTFSCLSSNRLLRSVTVLIKISPTLLWRQVLIQLRLTSGFLCSQG